MKRIALLGASGHGKVVAEIAELLGYQVTFFDDEWPKKKKCSKWLIVGGTDELVASKAGFTGSIVSIGDNSIRLEKQHYLSSVNVPILTLIHPSVIISSYASVGQGSVIMPGAIVNTDAIIGDSCIINTGATVDHDCVLSHGVHVSPGVNIAGNVKVGLKAWVGIGSIIKQFITIGENAIIGAGATVVTNIPADKLAVGCPARFTD